MKPAINTGLRVAQLLYSGLGGHGSVAFSLLNADKGTQWQPLMGFLGIEPLSPAYAEECKKTGVPHKYFPAVPGKPWRSWPGILRWLIRTRPAAIILHSVTALLPCWCYARSHRVPLIVVEHQSNALKKRSEWTISRLSMLFADRVVLLTPAYRQELQEKLGIFFRGSKVRVVSNGIDISRYVPIAKQPAGLGATVQMGMATRFIATKRLDVLIEMMAQLRRQAPAIDWRLSLAGNGETWEGVHAMALDAGLEECISLPGHLGEDELIRWFQSIDIYLHASDGETLSTSLLQAMAMGLPIVASDVSGVDNLLGGETSCGVLIEDSTPEGFAGAVQHLVNTPSLAKQLAQAARQQAVTTYSQDAMFAGYARLLGEACQNSPSSPSC